MHSPVPLLRAGLLLCMLAGGWAQPGAAAEQASTVDAAGWSVERAEQLARQRGLDALQSAEKSASPAAATELDRLRRQHLGIGVQHAPRDGWADLRAQAELQRMRAQLQQAQALSRAKHWSLPQALGRLQPKSKADLLSVVLRTAEQGVVNTGGYVFAYAGDGSYRGYSGIAANGEVQLPVAAGEPLNIYVFSNAPFARQVAIGVALQPGGDVILRRGRRVPVGFSIDGQPFAGTAAIELAMDADGDPFGPWAGPDIVPDTQFGAQPAIYLADGHRYTIGAFPEFPYLADTGQSADDGTSALAFEFARGLAVEVSFDDPDALRSGCGFYPSSSLRGYSLSANDPAAALELSRPHWIDPPGGGPSLGFRQAVPAGRAIDWRVSFADYDGTCKLQSWRLNGARVVAPTRLAIALRSKPQPTVRLRDPGGNLLTYGSGYFIPQDDPGNSREWSYFDAQGNSHGDLVAGTRYWALPDLYGQSERTPAVGGFVAQAGPFVVDVVVEPLATVNLRLLPAEGMSLRGTLECRRAGELVAAFELQSYRTQHQLKLPPGDYRLRLSGLTGSLDQSGQRWAVLLAPIERNLTVAAADNPSLDFSIAAPAAGVALDAQGLPSAVRVTAMQAGVPVANTVISGYEAGLRSDLDPLVLRLDGAGFDAATITLQPSPALPLFVPQSLLGEVPRWSGVLRDSAGQPLANSTIDYSSPSGDWRTWLSTDEQGRFDIAKVADSVLVFMTGDAGGDLMQRVEIANAGQDEQRDVRLTAAAFHAIDPAGPPLQRLYGSGQQRFRIVFLAEGYTGLHERFTDRNGNAVWDGRLFIDLNGDGLWQNNEPLKLYGEASWPYDRENTDVSQDNETFVDENADGYPNIDDHAVFVQNAKNYIRALLGTPEIRQGIAFDAYALFLPSAQAGVDVIASDGSTRLSERDTRFGASVELQRYLLNIDGEQAIAAIREQIGRWDIQVVLLNQPVPIGRANSFILGYGGIGNQPPNDMVAGHEFGHNPGGLGDEYDEFGGTAVGWYNPDIGHLSHETDPQRTPWADLLVAREDYPLSLPDSPGLGFYPGGSYQAGGVFRPSANSRMRGNTPQYNPPSQRKLRAAFCRATLDPAQLNLPARLANGFFASGFEAAIVPLPAQCP